MLLIVIIGCVGSEFGQIILHDWENYLSARLDTCDNVGHSQDSPLTATAFRGSDHMVGMRSL